jgi:hypothetical protein
MTAAISKGQDPQKVLKALAKTKKPKKNRSSVNQSSVIESLNSSKRAPQPVVSVGVKDAVLQTDENLRNPTTLT